MGSSFTGKTIASENSEVCDTRKYVELRRSASISLYSCTYSLQIQIFIQHFARHAPAFNCYVCGLRDIKSVKTKSKDDLGISENCLASTQFVDVLDEIRINKKKLI
jgi:hypothetical protein